jgi:serine/threonine protein kinase
MALALAVDPRDYPREFETYELPPTLGAYLVLGRIADGGMASIYRGEDFETGAPVALKMVRAPIAYQVASLNREIETLRGLRHPGVMRLLSAGTWNDTPWMALELLHGQTIGDRIDELWAYPPRPRAHTQEIPPPAPTRQLAALPRELLDDSSACALDLTIDDATDSDWAQRLNTDPVLDAYRPALAAGDVAGVVSLIERLAPAMDYVHGWGLVHCDVKPANLFVGDDDRVTLLDFGLARPARQRVGRENRRRLGTIEYASPEQIRGDGLDARADIYSLGCVIYELLSGRRPFEGNSPEETAQKHLDQNPVGLSDVVSGVSWALDDLMFDMLSKDRAHRPRSVAEVVRRLARAAAHNQ